MLLTLEELFITRALLAIKPLSFDFIVILIEERLYNILVHERDTHLDQFITIINNSIKKIKFDNHQIRKNEFVSADDDYVLKKALEISSKIQTLTIRVNKANAKFMAPLTPSAELAAVVGSAALPRTEAVKKMWDYIKKNGLQDAKNKRMINSDAKLAPIFEGKKQISMFDMSKYLSKHLSK